MSALIYFQTFCEPHEYAQLTNPYYAHSHASVANPGASASVAITNYLREQNGIRAYLWDSGDFVYGLS